jgi:hypothetical protein
MENINYRRAAIPIAMVPVGISAALLFVLGFITL